MSSNKLLYIVIALLIIVIGCGAYFIFCGKDNAIERLNNQPENVLPAPAESSENNLSEQPNKAKYDEYLSDIYLGKMAIGKKIGTDGFPAKTNVFTSGVDQFCTMMNLKKTILSGGIATAVYDVVAKQDSQLKTVFPVELKAGGSGGCGSLDQSAGKYEYKLYIDDVLVSVLPFEVK